MFRTYNTEYSTLHITFITIAQSHNRIHNTMSAVAAANSQNQQMQVLGQLTGFINNANAACAAGTECYNQQRIMDTKNAYDAAVINEKNAPENVEVARKNYLVAAKGQTAANQITGSRYQQNGQEEKDNAAQQFDNFYNDMSTAVKSVAVDNASIRTSDISIATLQSTLNQITDQDDDASNALNLLIRKIDYASQDITTIHQVEYYIKLVYWLAFLTWCACVLYERRFTMKTGGLFVLFTLFILLQNRIMNLIGFVIPADVNVRW